MWRSRLLHNSHAALRVGLVCAALAAAATGQATAQQPVPLDVTGATRVEFDDSAGVWELLGNPVTVRRGLVVLRAPAIRYDTRDQIVIASSGVSYGVDVLTGYDGTVTVWGLEGRGVAESDVPVTTRGGKTV